MSDVDPPIVSRQRFQYQKFAIYFTTTTINGVSVYLPGNLCTMNPVVYKSRLMRLYPISRYPKLKLSSSKTNHNNTPSVQTMMFVLYCVGHP